MPPAQKNIGEKYHASYLFVNNLKLDTLIYGFIIEYNHTNHPEIGDAPAARWQKNGFLPQQFDSIEQLDLLLLNEAKPRKIFRDGIRFQGLRYIDTLLAPYIGEMVVITGVWTNSSSYKTSHIIQCITYFNSLQTTVF